MELISKLIYQARIKGLDITGMGDEVKLMNLITKRYVHIIPHGRACSDDTLGQDKALKCLMTEFLIESFNDSIICIPCTVTLRVGDGTRIEDIRFARHCLEQCFANINNFRVVEDEDLLPHECRIEHEYVLSYKKRQAFIDACLEYLI